MTKQNPHETNFPQEATSCHPEVIATLAHGVLVRAIGDWEQGLLEPVELDAARSQFEAVIDVRDAYLQGQRQ